MRMRILDYQETPIGALCLRERELLSQPGVVITEITLDHVLLMSSHHTLSERALAELALARHAGSGGLRVLVGGLGLGYTARAVLDDRRVESLVVIERLPQVVEWFERGLFPLAHELARDPRLEVCEADVFERLLAEPDEPWDAILIDVDHAPSDLLDEHSRRFYTTNGQRRVRAHLRAGGVLAVWSTADDEAFPPALRTVYPRVDREIIRWWNDLIDEPKEDFLFLAHCDGSGT